MDLAQPMRDLAQPTLSWDKPAEVTLFPTLRRPLETGKSKSIYPASLVLYLAACESALVQPEQGRPSLHFYSYKTKLTSDRV